MHETMESLVAGGAPKDLPWPPEWPDEWDGDDAKLWNRDQVARALGVSLPTVDKMRTDGMPYRREGRNGRPYGYYLPEVWRWRTDREAAAIEERQRKEDQIAQAQLALIGGQADGVFRLKPEDRKKVYEAELFAHKARRERGELVEKAALLDRDERLLALLGQFLQSLPETLGRDLQWDVLATAACQDKVDQFQERLARLLMSPDGINGPRH